MSSGTRLWPPASTCASSSPSSATASSIERGATYSNGAGFTSRARASRGGGRARERRPGGGGGAGGRRAAARGGSGAGGGDRGGEHPGHARSRWRRRMRVGAGREVQAGPVAGRLERGGDGRGHRAVRPDALQAQRRGVRVVVGLLEHGRAGVPGDGAAGGREGRERGPGLVERRVEDHRSARQTFSAVYGGSRWRAERVRERVGDGRRRADRAALADPLGAERVQRRRRLHEVGRDLGDLGGGEQRVVERGLAVLVVDDLLGQARAETLDGAADHLALGEQRVDDPAGVVDRDEPRARARGRSPRSTSTMAA